MLILAHTDRFRVDFHQFGQRVLQTTGDRHGTTQGDIQVREFKCGQLRRGVNRRARFADDHLLGGHFRELFLQIEEEALGLAGGGTVADRHQLNVVLLTQGCHCYCGLGGLTGVRINGIGSHQLAGAVNHGHLHAGTQAGIEAHGGAQARRSGHQQVVQVIEIREFQCCQLRC
ncbi:hypothetical protein D3C75_652680 [compost metagenome]